MRLYMGAKLSLLEASPKLSGESLRVLAYLETQMQYGNIAPRVTDVAKALGMDQPNASRAFRALLEARFLFRSDAQYLLNPYVYWVGPERARLNFIRELPATFAQYVPGLVG